MKPKNDESAVQAIEVHVIAELIHPLLKGRSPQVQGAVIADLFATWLCGFQTTEARREARVRTLELTQQFIEATDKAREAAHANH